MKKVEEKVQAAEVLGLCGHVLSACSDDGMVVCYVCREKRGHVSPHHAEFCVHLDGTDAYESWFDVTWGW